MVSRTPLSMRCITTLGANLSQGMDFKCQVSQRQMSCYDFLQCSVKEGRPAIKLCIHVNFMKEITRCKYIYAIHSLWINRLDPTAYKMRIMFFSISHAEGVS